ncbi:MAG: PQQ-binding-like beta-propeller repeat protein, partial [Propionibacteriaceae bacterium]|nr:PQQ-binding-like beta-propeller repeat protein [Propionibacteriaceae bacterium]
VVGNSLRQVIGYDRYGSRLWTLPVAEVPTGLTAAGNDVLVSTGDGRLAKVSLGSGAVGWTRDLGAEASPQVTVLPGAVVCIDAHQNLQAMRLSDGQPLWDTSDRQARQVVSLLDGTVVEGDSRMLVGRSAASGEPWWQVDVRGQLERLWPSGRNLVVSTNLEVSALDRRGVTLWRTDRKELVSVSGEFAFLGNRNTAELRRVVDGAVLGRWRYDKPVSYLKSALITPRGVFGSLQPAGESTTFVEWA